MDDTTAYITEQAMRGALYLEGYVQKDIDRIVALAYRIQQLPESQRMLRVEHLEQGDVGKIVKVLPGGSDEYVTGRLSDLTAEPYSSRSEYLLVIDGKIYPALYRSLILVDDWSVESETKSDYVLRS